VRILVANWTWYPSGGDWTYVENSCRLYRQKGHTVVPFSMQDERNYPERYAEHFVSKINYRELNENKTLRNGIHVLSKSIYSFEAKRNLERLLNVVSVDVAHLHNIHHYLTPSIISVFRRRNIPIVWTLHDYTILCPENSFVSNGSICERCKGGKFYQCTLQRCKKNSLQASFVASLENYVHRFTNVFEAVRYFICPTQFVYDKFVEYGFYKDRLVKLYHCYDVPEPAYSERTQTEGEQPYILFVGRLEKIKGVHTLLRAMKELPQIRLKIIGSGSEDNELKRFADVQRLTNVSFLGRLEKNQVLRHMRHCLFSVCPSEWYEVMGFSIIEAMLLTKPVVGSRIGAIPELVLDGVTGLTFEAGNSNDLRDKIAALARDSTSIKKFGSKARDHVSRLVDYDVHYARLTGLFTSMGLQI